MANLSVNTYSGKSILWNRMKGSGTEAKNIGWGDGTPTGSQACNVNLFKPQTEVRNGATVSSTLATTSFLADTYQVVGTITCVTGAKTITEAGLFDATQSSNTTTLAAAAATNAATVTIGSISGFPTTGNYYVQVNNETVLVTGSNSTTLAISRSQLGSTVGSHASGSPWTIGGDGGASGSGATSGQTATVAASNGGSMFAHADFAGIPLGISDAIAFTWLDTLT